MDDATLRAATAEDKQLHLEDGLRPLNCQRCGNRVRVKKHSMQHTSIQWTSDSASSCPEVGARVAAGQHPARVGSCEYLRQTIDRAVQDGSLEVDTGGVEPG